MKLDPTNPHSAPPERSRGTISSEARTGTPATSLTASHPRPRRTRFALEWWLVLAISAALLALAVARDWTARLDHVAYDYALRLRGVPRQAPPPLLIVAIDERSLEQFGAWPWPRAVQAELIERLAEAHPRSLGIDLLLTEPRDPGGDQRLADALTHAGPVVLPVAFDVPGPAGAPFAARDPLPLFRPPNVTLGHVNLSPDADGVARRFYRTYAGAGRQWPALPRQMLEAPSPSGEGVGGGGSRHNATFGKLTGTTPLLIDWLGPPGTVPTVPASAVLHGEVPAALIAHRHVLVGVTASGLGDYHATPMGGGGALMAGVEIQANVLATLAAPRPLRPAPALWAYAFALVPLLLVFVAMRRLASPRAVLAALALALLLVAISAALFVMARIWLSPVAALVGIAVAWPLWAWRRLAVASRFVQRELERAAAAAGEPLDDLPAGPVLDRQFALLEAAGARERRLRADHDEAIRLLSHDMRSPQGAILALTDGHADEALPPETTARVRDLARRTLALADGFVHLARAQSVPLAPELHDLADIARNAAESLWAQSRDRRMPVALDTADEPPALVSGDGALLDRMACNLIENALKYGDPETPVRVTVTITQGRAILEVANSGPEIPLELQSRLFDRFARVPDAAARADGVGLGLAFVHTVAARHGGKVACRSGGGTTAFRVSLPLAPDQP